MKPETAYTRLLKPVTDRLLSTAVLLALFPVILVVTLLVRIRLGKPAFFRQTRTGKGGNLFTIYKFRSMTDTRDSQGQLLDDVARLTPFGQFLRTSSLDELPQLWNVVRGDMSLVGPRPLLPAYLPRYSAFQRRRHHLKPGITGLAQVSGRNALSWEQKFELDVQYTENVTLMVDAEILWKTVIKVLAQRDVSRDGHVTSPPFLGSQTTGETSVEKACE